MVFFSQAKKAVLLTAITAAAAASAFEAVPKASAKALGITRGKPFSSGLVFVNGKYIEPPYVVERWGTGIRINSQPVTGQIVDWSDFIKTQDPSRVEKTEKPAQPSTAPKPVASAPQVTYAQSDADALDDLFDDEPEAKKAPAPRKPVVAPSRPVIQPSAAPEPTYSLKGDFVKNDASKALVKRINDIRTEIDGMLRRGGFIFFGDGYSRVTGDSRTAEAMLEKLPDLMQRATSVHDLRQGIRSTRLVYINEVLAEQIFENRVDYRRLKERRQKILKDKEWESILNEANKRVL